MSGLFSMDAWSTVWNHKESFLLGLGNTLQTAVCALALAFAIGALLGLMATSGNQILKFVARVYVEFIQNTPLLLQLCFLYYALAFAGLSLGVIRTGIIALGVYTGAYMGEVVRAAIESVPKWCGPHQCDLQLCHRCFHRRRLRARLHRLRPHLLCGLLPAVHAGNPLGGFPQGTQGPCEHRPQDRRQGGTQGGCLT